MIQKSSVDC
uniref:Uncharacterized protein n=1 Tax=Arundo donax TaxID=35708 RepID=A0A0A9ADJ5_ARUDO